MSKRFRIYKSKTTENFPWRSKAEDCDIEYDHNFFVCGKGCDGHTSWQGAIRWVTRND